MKKNNNVIESAERIILEDFFKINQKNLLNTMYEFLSKYYDRIYKTNEFIYAVGSSPVALVAHLDTVFPDEEMHKKKVYCDQEKGVFWSPDGLGADDRAGVYSIVKIIQNGYRPSIILTTDEECGGVGAYTFVVEFSEKPRELKYLIELDRRGYDDCVFYDCDNPEFTNYVESFGFKTQEGLFSDISIICPHWEIPGVNLSIGYNNEHSFQETLNIHAMRTTIKKVEKMIEDSVSAKKFRYIKRKRKFNFLVESNTKNKNSILEHFINNTSECFLCGKTHSKEDLIEVSCFDDTDWEFNCCYECLPFIENLNWCYSCNRPFIDERFAEEKDYTKILCKNCKQEAAIEVGANRNKETV